MGAHYDEQLKLVEDLLCNYAILEESSSCVLGSWVYLPGSEEFLWSEGMYKLFGLEAGIKVTPDIYVTAAIEEYSDVAKKIAKSIYDGEPFQEYLQIKANDLVKTLRVFGAPRDVSGERQSVGVDIDVTDHNDYDKPTGAAPSYQELKNSYKAKTTLLNNLSQEFQNPITLVLESINKVIHKVGPDLPDRITNELLHAQKNALRMEKLVKTLNDITHLDQRRENAHYVPTDVCRLTTELASSFRPVIEKAGLTFAIQCERIYEPLYVDHSIFETVLFNLLTNAFKFTFEGGIIIKITNARKHVKIAVADTGNGISPINQKKIFQRFTKVETESARSLDGMGVGLPLVKELVEIHGGTITVHSQPKKGSEFIVSLPKGVTHLPPAQVATSASVHRGAGSLRATLHQIESWPTGNIPPTPNDNRVVSTVMVAESDNEMRSHIARLLHPKYKVLEATNGQQVLDLIDAGLVPDLIVADVSMPKMNGFELLSSVRNSSQLATLPFILLTTRTVADEEIKGLYFGADDYLVKPFSTRELLARVETRIEIAVTRKKPVQSLTKANTALEERVHHYMEQLENYNKELNEKNAKLTAVNDELTGLTFAASHDLREPMRKVKLFIGRLLKEEKEHLSGRSAHYFERILSFVQTMNDLVNDITLYANFNDTVGRASNIDLHLMLTSLIDFLIPIIREKGASIKFDVADGLSGNYDQVKQAIYNLVNNALKFGRKGVPLEINITGKLVDGSSIGCDRADKTKTYYCIIISDNGIGIDPAYYKQIFELFRKLHERSVYPGTGIGLAIVRRIMENHNGFVIVESKPCEGSRFSCYFPQSIHR